MYTQHDVLCFVYASAHECGTQPTTGNQDLAAEFAAKLSKTQWAARPGGPAGPEAGASDFRGLSYDRLPGGVGEHVRAPLLTAKSGFQELLEAGDARGGLISAARPPRAVKKAQGDDDWKSTVLDDTLLPT
jgi:hypothetical protein